MTFTNHINPATEKKHTNYSYYNCLLSQYFRHGWNLDWQLTVCYMELVFPIIRKIHSTIRQEIENLNQWIWQPKILFKGLLQHSLGMGLGTACMTAVLTISPCAVYSYSLGGSTILPLLWLTLYKYWLVPRSTLKNYAPKLILPEGQRPEDNIAQMRGIIFQCWPMLTVHICFVISRKTGEN